ncbi:MAG: trypsin-like peptidase domain-containing protein [Burkholderiaceae bacterium]
MSPHGRSRDPDRSSKHEAAPTGAAGPAPRRSLVDAAIALFVALLLLDVHGAAAADEALEVQRLVAVYTARFEGSEPKTGTAVVFALTPGRIYLVTAAHAVRHNGRSPSAIELKLGGSDPELGARLEKFDDKGHDIAVLVVERPAAGAVDLADLPFDRLAAAGSAKRGDPVFVVGNRRNALSVNVTPDRVSAVNSSSIRFESKFVVTGFSGGPLFNERWQLLGLVLSDDPPEVEAIAFVAVAAKLRQWKLPLALRPPYTQVSAGSHASCRVGADGAAQCWGALGFDDPLPLEDQRLAIAGVRWRSISVGKRNLCGIDDAGAAWCLGLNPTGQLGNGSTVNSISSPVRVAGGLVFSAISVGGHSCAIAADGAAWCWGQGDYGQLGNDSNRNSTVPVQVAGGLKFSSVSAGLLHSCGVTTAGGAWCWGSNELAPLGVGTSRKVVHAPAAVMSTVRFQAVSARYQHSCALATDASLWCWGVNDKGQLGDGTTTDRETAVRVAGERRFKRLATGTPGSHSCALAEDGAAYCWGFNADGQLGNGNTRDSPRPVAVSGGLKFVSISAGRFHTCAVTLDDALWCWGSGRFDGLGTGAGAGSAVPVQVVQ